MNSFPATELINADCERMDKPAQSSGLIRRIDCTMINAGRASICGALT